MTNVSEEFNTVPGIWYLVKTCLLFLCPYLGHELNSQSGHILSSKFQLLIVSQLAISYCMVLGRMVGDSSMNLHSH